ncbi:MAG: bifunctional diaminohydroxyphosphoribosylaminopyrimidine deaminase/5-amino-6-(5-phosphoribosylamino)uracil reductase RibD [Patescibacteria group bacterium]
MKERFMKRALSLAREGLGKTSPNPCVGAVLVKSNRVIGDGFHEKAGKDHAEVVAIKKAGETARNSTLYATLEPCCHHGKTPPCVDVIAKAGIKQVFVAMKDPNPLVNGKGIEALRRAGIEVMVGMMEDEARMLNQPYIKNMTASLPYVVLKTACTLDFKIADANGRSKWITSKEARQYARVLRSHYDAILTGSGTVLADNPMLSAVNKPLRIILGESKIPSNYNVFRDGNVLVIKKRADLKKLLEDLWKKGVRSVFVEGGNGINNAFVKSGLVDKYCFFVAPKYFGDGLNAFDTPPPKFLRASTAEVGTDELLEGFAKLY